MLVKVHKKGNIPQLRLLFPQLLIAQDYPQYGPIIYSTFEYPVSDDTLFLLESAAGFNLDTQSGLVMFLRAINYMAPSKIEKFSKITDFGDKELVYAMYHEALSLKIANRSYLEHTVSDFNLVEFLQLPFYEAYMQSQFYGSDVILGILLTNLVKYYSRDSSISAAYYHKLSELFLGFNSYKFKTEYRLTGDSDYDLVSLLLLFPKTSRI